MLYVLTTNPKSSSPPGGRTFNKPKTAVHGTSRESSTNGRGLGRKWEKGRLLGVSKNRGGVYPPKWMVKIMVPNPIKLDDLGGFTTPIFGNTLMMVHGSSWILLRTSVKVNGTIDAKYWNLIEPDMQPSKLTNTLH